MFYPSVLIVAATTLQAPQPLQVLYHPEVGEGCRNNSGFERRTLSVIDVYIVSSPHNHHLYIYDQVYSTSVP